MCTTECCTPGPQRLREVRVHVPEVDREPRVSAGGGGGRRGQAQAQGDQYYTISTGSFSKNDFSQGAVNEVFLGLFH